MPRITLVGERNAIHVMRLKDKLGNKSNASSEIEYHDAFAILLGERGRGVNVIIDMVHHTRLGTVAGTVGIMRMAFVQALNHIRGRRAFQKTLIDQPLMRLVIADLAVEYEAAVVLGAPTWPDALAKLGGKGQRAFARLAVALAKYWLTKRNPQFVFECMESQGGVGYVEETPMPRLFRESPLNAIWEGSGNVIALDIVRTLRKEPNALEAYLTELELARGLHSGFARIFEAFAGALHEGVSEVSARHIAETMALMLQAALLLRHGVPEVAVAFCELRLGEGRGINYGAGSADIDAGAIIARQMQGL